MLNRLLLLCALSVLIISCSTPDSDTQPVGSLADTCLLTRIQHDSINYESIEYDTLIFFPLRTFNDGRIERKYSYINNLIKVINFARNEIDKLSIEVFTLDSDKKVISMFSRRKNIGNRELFTNLTYQYNTDKTIKSIRATGIYSDGSNSNLIPVERRFGWTNGNLTSDSTFGISDIGTPQETKGLLRNKLFEYNTYPDLKGFSCSYYGFLNIPNLYGKGSRNLVSKYTEYPVYSGVNPETEVTYVFDNMGLPIKKKSTGKYNGETTYSYTCYKRK